MKNILKVFIILICFIFIDVKAENICYTETHYYYLLYQQVSEFECYNLSDNKKVQTTCDGTTNINTNELLFNELKNNLTSTNSVKLSSLYLPEDYNVKALTTEHMSNLTKDDYYMLFDALINQNTLSDSDKKGIINTDKSYVYKKIEGQRATYYHLLGDYSENKTSFLSTVKTYYDTLSKDEKLAYRDSLVNELYNKKLSVESEIGIGTDDFKILTEENLNLVFDKDVDISIKSEIKPNSQINPVYYYNNTNTRMLSYIVPIKIEATIESNCNRTCNDVNEEYKGCVDSNTCNANLIKEYEKCNPLQMVKNPDTDDLNKPLVILVIIGTICIFIITYKKSRESRRSI